MSWLSKASPQEQMEAQLLRQWRAGRFQDRLLKLPVNLLLRDQLRQLQRSEEAELEATGCLPAHQKLRKLIWKGIAFASSKSVRWLNLRPCLLWLHRLRIRMQAAWRWPSCCF